MFKRVENKISTRIFPKNRSFLGNKNGLKIKKKIKILKKEIRSKELNNPTIKIF